MSQLKTLENQLEKKYRYSQPTAKDIQTAISYYNDLRTMMSTYIFPDGQSKELMTLVGTIPINYKGSSYNIPVEVWLMDSHPYNPPMCYVKPTADMKIKPSRHVDQNGRVYLPYLTDWNHAKSDLLGCCQIMAMAFGDEPPVYSKKGAARNANTGSPNMSNTNYPPMSMPMPQTGAGGGYPAYPPAPPSSYPQQPYSQAYPPVGYQQPSVQPNVHQPYPPAAHNPPVRNSYPINGPVYPTAGPPYAPFVPATDSKQAGNTGTITDEHIRASLLSAVEEKLGRRLNDIVTQAQAEITSLSRTHDELERGRKRLDDIFVQLEKEQRTVEKNIQLLAERIVELRSALEKVADNGGSTDIDDMILPAAPLYKQLLNAYAEDCALEDAMYYVGEALRRNAIDLDVFLKQTRELSRKQFIQRALVQKCREKAGLP